MSKEKNGKKGGKLKWIIIVILVLGVIGAATGGKDDNDSKQASNDANTTQTNKDNNEESILKEEKEESKPEIEYTTYTVTQMMDDLETNALKAESTYKDQYVEITGRLGTIDSNGKYITLYSEEDEFAIIGVQCYIKNEEQKEKVMEMSTDDIITLKGKITSIGEVLGYSLDIDEIK